MDEQTCGQHLADGAYPIGQLRQTIARLFPHMNVPAQRAHLDAGIRMTLEDYDELRRRMASVLRWHEEARDAATRR